jgi:TonB family protein
MRVRPVALACLVAACLVSHVRSAQDPVRPGPGITNPSVVFEQKPAYTENALRAKVQGIVEVEAEIKEDGTVGMVRIHKSLDKVFGLDLEALKAARGWRFKPATKDGKPVPFVVIIQLEFKLDPKLRQADAEFERDAQREGTPGLVMPKGTWEEKPRYTAEAMRQKVQGIVEVQAVVGPDGKVARARVSKSLDAQYGLDDAALTAARLWRFEPGTLNGTAVPVLMTLKLEFRLH